MMRTTITLEDDVFAAAKTLAESSGRSLGEVISELARRGLERPHDAPVRGSLPAFRVRPGAKIIPGNRAAELLAEEGEG